MNSNERKLNDDQLFSLEQIQRDPERYVDDLAHDLLDEEASRIVQEWCRASQSGELAWQQALERKAKLAAVGIQHVKPGLVKQAMSKIDQRVQRRQHGWKLYRRSVIGVTAACVMMAAAFTGYYAQLKPSPCELYVVGQTEWMAGAPGGLQIVVRDRRTGEELNVPVEATLLDSEKGQELTLASFNSGEVMPRFRIPDWAEGKYRLTLNAKVRGKTERLVQTIELERPWKLMLTTDKPMYQPGQVVHLRTLALRQPQLEPIRDSKVTFRVRDPRGNTIFKQSQSTSQFGIASTDCELASEIDLGDYEVECEVDGVTSVRTIKVDRYVLPKIQASLRFDRPFYEPGSSVEVSVQAKYVFGKSLTGGKVRFFAEADGLNVDLGPPVEKSLEAGGQAQLTMKLPRMLVGRPDQSGMARIRVVAQIEDAVGQQVTVGGARVVTDQPILLDVIPATNLLVEGVENELFVSAVYADGRPAIVDVNVDGASGSLEAKTLRTNEMGIGRLTLAPEELVASITLTAKDREGLEATIEAPLLVSNDQNAYLLRSDRVSYQGGDTIRLEARGNGTEPIFVDLVKDRQTISTHRLRLDSGKGSLEIDLPAEVFGTIRVESYRLVMGGLVSHQTQLIVIQQADALQVRTEFDKSQYRPGERAKLKFSLTDSAGNPRPGALGVSIVDEALFALLQSEGTLAQSFFLLEQELLKPILTAYPEWDPFPTAGNREGLADSGVIEDTNKAQAKDLFERALFAWLAGRTKPSPSDLAWQRGASDMEAGESTPLQRSPYSLTRSSFPDKRRRVEAARRTGLQRVKLTWIAIASSLTLALIAGFAFAYPRLFAILTSVGLVGGLACSCLLIPYSMSKSADATGMAGAEGLAEGAAWMENDGSLELGGPQLPRVRKQFPETLFWDGELITDDQGVAEVELDLADSITTWRLSINASDLKGNLGVETDSMLVFQEFQVDLDLPVQMKRGDEVDVPVVVYNFTEEEQIVRLQIADSEWFEKREGWPADLELLVQPDAVASVSLPIRLVEFGQHQFEVAAIGSTASDAIQREIEVIPNGVHRSRTTSGRLSRATQRKIEALPEFVEGSDKAVLTLYPSTFSQLVGGIEGIFRRPYGCFEQTSSATYPNVLALQYLANSELSVPQVEVQARKYIHLGYQRLVTFEVPTGGFDWYGQGEGKLALTAYGLLEFKDMAKVHPVDPRLLERTEKWLLSQRQPDGSWSSNGVRGAGIVNQSQLGKEDFSLLLTSTIAWALYSGSESRNESGSTADYLLGKDPAEIENPYTLAMLINALVAMNQEPKRIEPFTNRLAELAMFSEDRSNVFWKLPTDERTVFYGSDLSGSIECTALAVLALVGSEQQTALIDPAQAWLLTKQDESGTWQTTQATVLALKALLAAGSSNQQSAKRSVDVELDGTVVATIEILPEQAEVVQRFDLAPFLAGNEAHLLELKMKEGQPVAYRLDQTFFVDQPDAIAAEQSDDFELQLTYDKSKLELDEVVRASLLARNQTNNIAPMVMIDLPIPPGFAVDRAAFEKAMENGQIGRFEITPTEVILYLRGLVPNEPFQLEYDLRAAMPVKVNASAARIYEYYNPERVSWTSEVELEISK